MSVRTSFVALALVLASVWGLPATGRAQDSDEGGAPGGIEAAVRKAEAAIDSVAGKVVGAIADVMFFDPFKTTVERVPAGPVRSVEDVRGFVAEVEAAGLDPQETDFALVIGVDDLADAEREALGVALREEFTAGRTRGFSLGTGSERKFTASQPGIPIILLWLIVGATFFTLRMGFINFRAFKHAILVTMGRYDNDEDEGEVNHFQALSAALSATVGLGNIAGVAIAVSTGGPGATFWMIIAGLLGMSSKFTECTLAQMYREVRNDGRIMGGAMYYLSNGLRDLGAAPLGKALAVLFCVMCIIGSFGGGNAFQVNQSLGAVRAVTQDLFGFELPGIVYGLVMAVLVGIVIIGGIRRIANTAEKIVPAMCGIYVSACLFILIKNAGEVPAAVGKIVSEAFTPEAGYGALLGVLVQGFRRAAFSNEAGIGSAAIAHSAAKTEYPAREGIVALLEPFIDTIIVCTMTALVIVITGAYENPAYAPLIAGNNGAALTSEAMREEISWFPYILALATMMFAYSTMISWSYYGERCWTYLFGDGSSLVYRILFVIVVVLGAIISATSILDISDLMILGMAFPNVLGLALLSGKVKAHLDEYWALYKSGRFDAQAG